MWKTLRLSAALVLVVTCWAPPTNAQSQVKKLKPVPFGINSFGAATIGNDIYVYGGHTGRAHSYSIDGVSSKLLRLDTSGKSDWEVVSEEGPILQGLALVSHGGKLYRVGGLTVRKAAGAPDKPSDKKSERDLDTEAGETEFASGITLKSLASVACFDPKTKKWTNLPGLPEPRSSHDAVVVDGMLFVVGGWMLNGAEGEEEWSETVYKMNLNAKSPTWKKFTPPKAPRRAHSLAALDGKLFLIGGMDDEGEVLNNVAVYNIAADKWSEASAVPSEHRFASFGNSAFAVGGSVYCMGIDGSLRSIDSPKAKWKTVTQTQPRFFHRVVNLKGAVGIVGGSNMETGFTNDTLVFATTSALKAKPAGQMTALKETLGKLKSATPDEYKAMIAKIADGSDRADLVKVIRSGVSPQPNKDRAGKLKKGWTEWEATDESGKTRPYQLYLPESVAAGKQPAAVIVHIHGAVGKPDFGRGAGNPSAVGYAGFLWPKVAEANDYVIVCPVGRNECAWWTDNGVSHVNAVIRDVRRSISVPDQSIFGSGFSDGASGCYYLSMAAPGQFAGFYAMNGHPRVAASASGKQLYLRNMAATPLVSGMTQEDSLYPSKNVLPHITKAIALGAPITLVSYPNVNHQPLYFDDQTSTIVNFFKKTKRADDRKQVRWLTSDTKTGTVAWAEIMEIGATKMDGPELEEVNVMSRPGRISLGVGLEGNKLSLVAENSVAESSGYKLGDELVSFEGTAIAGTRALRAALAGKTYGDKFTSIIRRDGKEMTIAGRFPDFTPEPVYKHDAPAAYIDCSINTEDATISLTSRRVKKLRVWLPDELAGKKTVMLKRSGSSSELEVRQLSSADLLTSFAKSADAQQRTAYVDIEG